MLHFTTVRWLVLVSDIAIFVLKRDVKLRLTNQVASSFSFANSHVILRNGRSKKVITFYKIGKYYDLH